MQIKRHTCGLPPPIMLEPHSIWVVKSNYNFISLPGQAYHLTLYKKLKKNNLGKAYNPRRERSSNQTLKQTLNQNQTNLPHPRIQKAPILSLSRQWIWQGNFTLIKLEVFQSHPEKEKYIYWWPTIMIQTPFIRSLWNVNMTWIEDTVP